MLSAVLAVSMIISVSGSVFAQNDDTSSVVDEENTDEDGENTDEDTEGTDEDGEGDSTGSFDPNTDKVWSEAVYMVNLDTDDVVFEKNADKRMYPASTTKIMTAIIVLENVSDLNKRVEVPYECFDEFVGDDPNKWDPSNADIQPLQDNLNYRDCLYALMLPSACEAANILAYNVCRGNMKAFYDKMNKKAEEIGCTGTHFSNAHGLYEDANYTTARDLYLITRYAYENLPYFMEICNTYEYEMPANANNPNPYYIYSTISLIRPTSIYYYEYAQGVKTGTIDQAGRCLVSTAKKQYTYMLVTLGAPIYDDKGEFLEEWYSMVDAINLYEWAFENFAMATVVSKQEQITEVDVELGENATHVILVPESDYAALMPKSVEESGVQKTFTSYSSVKAPVKRGDVLGVMDVKFKGKTIATLNLVASNDVVRSDIEYYMLKIKTEISKTWFKVSVAAFVVLFICTIISFSIDGRRKRKLAAKEKRRYSNYAKKR